MKALCILALSIALLAGCTAAPCKPSPDCCPSKPAMTGVARTISVSGKIDSKIAPDHVVWRISLRDASPDLGEAKAMSDEKTKSVIELRKMLGLAEGDIETGQLHIIREYYQDQMGRRGEFKEYAVTRSVTIKQRDLSQTDRFFSALVSSADMEVSFSYESSKVFDVRAETRLKALEAAKAKADAMAWAVGATLGDVITINEHSQDRGWQSPASNFDNGIGFVEEVSADAASDTFVPGAITVSSTVYVTFALN